MVEDWVYDRPDFAAQLQAIPQPETGVRCLLRQCQKLDFMYADDLEGAWMIYYALLDAEEKLLPNMFLCEGEVKAYFRVLNEELRQTIHKERIQIGTKFYVVAGRYRVAEGVVSEILCLGNCG